jgi:hypothetical protein
MNLCCPCRSLAGRRSLTTFDVGSLAPDGCRRHGMLEAGRPVLAHHKPWAALPWPPWRSTRFCARHHAAWDAIYAPEAWAGWRGSLKESKLFERIKVMSLSGSNDRPVPDGGNPVLPGAADPRNAAARQRLAKALRANLGRRKAQKRERRKQTGDPAESNAAQSGASTKQD